MLKKDEVNYSHGKQRSHCGKCFLDDKFYCEHFNGGMAPDLGKCEIVSGPINPVMWCEKFERTSS